MTPQQYCKQKAAQSGSNFYYSFLLLPADKRDAIITLYAFCREVDDVADSDGEPAVRQQKLQWWHAEIQRLFSGQAQHPVTLALTPIIARFNLPREHFEEIIAGMEMDLGKSRYANYRELGLYCHRVAGVVGLMSAEIFGYTDRNTLKYAHELGMAFQLTNILRDVHEDALKGRVYLPLDELAHAGLDADHILQHRSSPALTAVLTALGKHAQQHYAQAFALLPPADRYAQRAGLMMAAIYQTLLQEIIKDGYQVLQYRISLPGIRKFWIATRTLIREWWRELFFRRHG